MMDIERLLALALDELDETDAAAVDAHVLACGGCAATLDALLRIGGAVRDVVRAGGVAFPCSARLLDEMRAARLISRDYRLAPNQVVPCTVGADDIYAATTLEADLRDVAHVDIVRIGPGGTVRMRDVPFDADRGLAMFLSRGDHLRGLPSTRVKLELVAVDPSGERTLGTYFLDHTAFAPPPTR